MRNRDQFDCRAPRHRPAQHFRNFVVNLPGCCALSGTGCSLSPSAFSLSSAVRVVKIARSYFSNASCDRQLLAPLLHINYPIR